MDNNALNQLLTVVVPMNNSKEYIKQTLLNLDISAQDAETTLNVLLIDDGSTDSSSNEVIQTKTSKYSNIILVKRSNVGRFLTRKEGAKIASTPWVLFVDSRVLVRKDLISLAVTELRNPSITFDAINCHVIQDTKTSLLNNIWLFLSYVFWNIKEINDVKNFYITKHNFAKVPKGTTCLFVRRYLFLKACDWV